MESPIAANVTALRKRFDWTQEALAGAAGVALRTVQRVEEGKAASVETLRSIAAAFNVSVDELRRDSNIELMRSLKRRFVSVALERMDKAAELVPQKSVHYLMFRAIGVTSEEGLDGAAELEQWMQDAMDIWSELEPVQRRAFQRDAQALLDKLAALKLCVGIGEKTFKMSARTELPPAANWCMLFVIVTPCERFKPFVLWDRGEDAYSRD